MPVPKPQGGGRRRRKTGMMKMTGSHERQSKGSRRRKEELTLDSFAKVVAAAFAFDHLPINFPGGNVVVAVEGNVQETLVIAQVQVHLTAIIKDIHFAMLVRAKGPRVYPVASFGQGTREESGCGE